MIEMPLFDYQCYSCGLKFEQFVKRTSKKKEQAVCTSCGKIAVRVLSELSFAYDAETLSEASPQNSGISSFDYNFDKVIGQDAKKKWDLIEERVNQKKQVLQNNPEAKGEDLSLKADGSYQVMTKKQKEIVKKARAIDKLAVEHFKKNKKSE